MRWLRLRPSSAPPIPATSPGWVRTPEETLTVYRAASGVSELGS
ncbi:hypothetical protein [Nonomuraea guangzhouensis]|uniref:Uncharacterized protein n=1 Tax=Nonomuraea guangzhouensis TaxID=1291555 RepID=A0ABW4GY70_9ACTN|nr:hypothetical protein [Nonomuraea guangzhouensis]